ncbi:U3 small nucleolar ribonucleoprotein IMP4 [Methanohalophilus levihalophilus]|uniref:hypothetical protein n=1 Tax=Methanohalophilus levihalophilus TaxID=1431282 RepID=UPI001AE9DF3D|nr:hypothetical protein [Methanohalophilus levihalophilus]MBP2029416.1 U3 small nucleolar ribonucleoprotein IMP4 [Methanohalophilus levihalophilus]
MLISSSRSPSQSTRSVCKWLASFFGCSYLNRGKRSLGELLELEGSDPLILVGEYHGNPSSFLIYTDGVERLSVWMTVTAPQEKLPRRLPKPSIEGKGDLFNLLSSALAIPVGECNKSCFRVSDDTIDFFGGNGLLFRFNVKSFKECVDAQ